MLFMLLYIMLLCLSFKRENQVGFLNKYLSSFDFFGSHHNNSTIFLPNLLRDF